MKKLIPLILAGLIICSFNYALANSVKPDGGIVATLSQEQKEMQIQLISKRVKEIKAIDRSQLSKMERKALRTELRSLKKQASGIAAGGVFLTVGTLLVVILLLILLL